MNFNQTVFSFILLFWVLPLSSSNANSVTDSLLYILPNLAGEERVDALAQLAWELKFSKNKQGIDYAKEALELAKSIQYTKGEGKSTYQLSVLYSIGGKFEKSNELAEESMRIHRQLEDVKFMAKIWNVLGINHMNMSSYDEALTYYQKALDLSKLLSDTTYILKTEGNIGNIHYMRGNYEKALIAYNNLIEYGKATKDTVTWATNLSNAAGIYSLQGKHPMALEKLFFVLDLYAASNSKTLMAQILNDIGLILKRVHLYEEATEIFLTADTLHQEIGDYKQRGMIQNNLGIVQFRLEDHEKALAHYEKALEFYQIAKVKSKGNVLGNIAKIYRAQGDLERAESILLEALANDSLLNRSAGIALRLNDLGVLYLDQKQLDQAEKYLLQSYALWKEIGQMKDLSANAGILSNLYTEKGDLEKAMTYLVQYKETQDSVYGIEQNKEILRILLEREKAKQSNEMRIEQAASTSFYSGAIFWGGILFLCGIGLAGIFWLKRRSRNLNLAIQQDFTQQSEQVATLQSTLEQKNLETAFLSLTIIQKNEFIQQISKKLKVFAQNNPQNKEAQQFVNAIHIEQVSDQEWQHFKDTFEQISPDFFTFILSKHPKLSNKEMMHCAMIRLNIPPKDVAQIFGISMSGVHKSRYRLRKQFGLHREESLEHYLNSLELSRR